MNKDEMAQLIASVIQRILTQEYSKNGGEKWQDIADLVPEDDDFVGDLTTFDFAARAKNKMSTNNYAGRLAAKTPASGIPDGFEDEIATTLSMDILNNTSLFVTALREAAGYPDNATFLDEFFDEFYDAAETDIDPGDVATMSENDINLIRQAAHGVITNMSTTQRRAAEDNCLKIIIDIMADDTKTIDATGDTSWNHDRDGNNPQILDYVREKVQDKLNNDSNYGLKKQVQSSYDTHVKPTVKDKVRDNTSNGYKGNVNNFCTPDGVPKIAPPTLQELTAAKGRAEYAGKKMSYIRKMEMAKRVAAKKANG